MVAAERGWHPKDSCNEDQSEWHIMTINRTTGPDCTVMCNLINTHSHTV